VIAVADLAAAADELAKRHGIASVEGGRHPWGTANRIVPLGGAYLELVTVVDEAEAMRSPFGRWVASRSEPVQLLGWAVRTDRLDRVAARLGLEVVAGSRGDLRWRLAGVEAAAAEPSLPFFIAWAPGARHPGGGGPRRTVELQLEGDAGQLAAWLGPHALPVTIRPGRPGVASLVVDGRLVL
jgi:hypothetical protein